MLPSVHKHAELDPDTLLTLTATEYHAKTLIAAHLRAMPLGSVLVNDRVQSWRRFFEGELSLHVDQVILSPTAEWLLWYDIVKAHSGRDCEEWWAFATLLQDTDHLVMLYGISLEEIESIGSMNGAFFVRLRRLFDDALQAQKATLFLRALAQYKGPIGPIELHGFVDFPPLYQQVLQHCAMHRPVIHEANQQDPGSSKDSFEVDVLEARDARDEFCQAIRHIAAEAAHHPSDTFALVVNPTHLDWSSIYLLLKSDLKDVVGDLPYQLSKGLCLADQPWFQFAYSYLSALSAESLEVFSRVWVSPFWGNNQDERALWDQKLREKTPEDVDFKGFVSALVRVSDGAALSDPVFDNWTHWKTESRKIQRFYMWWDFLRMHLQSPLSDWLRFLKKLAALQTLPALYSFSEFLQILHHEATEFYLERPTQANIRLHIVGYLEVVDLVVDHVWLMSADEESLPLRSKRQPFIPEALLLRHHVPIGVEAEVRYATNLIARIQRVARIMTVSFVPERAGFRIHLAGMFREREKRLHLEALETVLADFEWALDSACTPVSSLVIRGGSRILEEQAACPFKAFGHFRLRAKALSSGIEFLSPLQKGIVVHRILELIWDALKTHDALISLSEFDLNALIQSSIAFAINEFSVGLEKEKQLIYEQLEKSRLQKLIRDWLDYEKARPPFEVIARERSTILNLAGLTFHFRLDRVDLLESGEKMVIDYKTGEVALEDPFKSRLEQAQLPLYAMAEGEKCHAVAYASLKSNKMGFVGLARDEDLAFGKVKASSWDWSLQLAHWREALTALVLEFQSGVADVSPLPQACLYCDLQALCRIKDVV